MTEAQEGFVYQGTEPDRGRRKKKKTKKQGRPWLGKGTNGVVIATPKAGQEQKMRAPETRSLLPL